MVMAGALGLVGLQAALHYSVPFPLSRKFGAYKIVQTGLWPRILGRGP